MKNTEYADMTWKKLIETLLVNQRITSTSYENWFVHTEAIDMDSKTLTIGTNDNFTMNWLKDNYTDLLEEELLVILGQSIRIYFIEKNKTTEDPLSATQLETGLGLSAQSTVDTLRAEPVQEYSETNLNQKLTFDNFVSGSSNQLAYNIAVAISENPGSSYNPMFLYGGSGLGKTHLIQAIGNHIAHNLPDKRVLYVTSEAFLSDYVSSIRAEKTAEFREKYRKIDILIVDDIQFFVGKEGIQEEFFHTFNHLHQLNKQIIITSDSQPNELTTLTERLRSRFSWGILTDIQPPELETRMAILHKKIDSFSTEEEVPEEVIEYIASNIDTNVRDLEGALNGLFAHAVMLGKLDITLDLAVESLRSYTKKDTQKVSITKIQKSVAKYFHITPDDLKSKTRKQPILSYRHIAIYLCKTMTDNSLQKIGKQFGNRDHTTIMNSVENIKKQIRKDPDLQAVLEELETLLKS